MWISLKYVTKIKLYKPIVAVDATHMLQGYFTCIWVDSLNAIHIRGIFYYTTLRDRSIGSGVVVASILRCLIQLGQQQAIDTHCMWTLLPEAGISGRDT